MNNVSQQSCRGLKKFVQYIRDRNALKRQAFMAANEDEDYGDERTSVESDLVAILDLGCNKTCHGSRWFLKYVKAIEGKEEDYPLQVREGQGFVGIGGKSEVNGNRHMSVGFELRGGGIAVGTLVSTELKDSDAPLLLSMLIRGSWDWCWSLEKARTRSIATIYKNIFTWSPPPIDFWEFDFYLPMWPCLAR